MTVTTRTPWDIVLNDVTGALPANPRSISPRAAYQAALYDRAVLVDLRSSERREHDGELPTALNAVVISRFEHEAWLSESLAARILLIDDGDTRQVPDDPRVSTVVGGFTAWRAAGLPTSFTRC